MWKLTENNSWYNNPVIKTKKELFYLKQLETIWKVQDANRNWVPYKLQPHQIEWHLEDVALKKHKAKDRVVIKSRNTSFTTSSIISNLMSIPEWGEQVIPFVRLNQERANDLIEDTKKYVRHMTPIQLPDGSLYPFDPDKVDMEKAGSVKFPNGVEFRAFPATNSAAEIIRGLRIVGSAGIIDESNFMKDFKNIFVALRDSSAGSIDGNHIFQMNVGTTLKGMDSKFFVWFKEQKKLQEKNLDTSLKFFYWYVFNPDVFRDDIELTKQDIKTIVPWHSINTLNQKFLQDKQVFMEEYMCVPAEKSEAFYKLNHIYEVVNLDLVYKTATYNEKDKEWDIARPHNPSGTFYMGVDVASIHDFFVISIFEHVGNKYIQRFLFYKRQVDLDDMEELTAMCIDLWKPVRCRIDSTGQGFQIGQTLKKKYGSVVDAIRGSKLHEVGGASGGNVKGIDKNQTVPVNEFLHTNQKRLIIHGDVELLNDDMQIAHYTQWDYNFKAASTNELGHGDIVIANGFALLPLKYKSSKVQNKLSTSYLHNKKKQPNVDEEILKEPEIIW